MCSVASAMATATTTTTTTATTATTTTTNNNDTNNNKHNNHSGLRHGDRERLRGVRAVEVALQRGLERDYYYITVTQY